MTRSRKLMMSLLAFAMLALTACGTATSMLPQPASHAQTVTRTIQDDTPQNPK